MAALEWHDEPAPVPLVLAPLRDFADELRNRLRPLNASELAQIASVLGPATQPPARGPQGVMP